MALQVAREFDAINAVQVDAESEERAFDLVIASFSNSKVERFIERLEGRTEDLRITFLPQGALTLKPPPSEAPDQVEDVEPRNAIEVFLAGHQSIGSWTTFLGYAVAAGIVVWIGIYTNTSYLLTAAMLIAPFAGPAMNTAIATAAGDADLLRRGLLRYAAALGVSVAMAFGLSMVLQQEVPSPTMIARSQVSAVAVLLPLVAGVSGALFLTASDRSSLVSGAAVGVLVAASLAPPAGVLGMAVAIGRWDLTQSGLFVLVLQLVGIHLSGTLVFHLFGLGRASVRHAPSSRWIFPVGLAVSALLLGGLLVWQFAGPVALERPTIAQRAVVEMKGTVRQSGLAEPVDVRARFLRAETEGKPTLLGQVVVRPSDQGAEHTPEVLREQLTEQLGQAVQRRWPSLVPLVDVTVLSPPPPQKAPALP